MKLAKLLRERASSSNNDVNTTPATDELRQEAAVQKDAKPTKQSPSSGLTFGFSEASGSKSTIHDYLSEFGMLK